jgi:prevent-host-death family protein
MHFRATKDTELWSILNIMKLTDDIRSVTELKRNTRQILSQARQTGRPVVLTVNGRADAVLLDAKTFEKHLSASNLARLVAPAEEDLRAGRTRPIRTFLRDFKRAHKISS